MPLLGRAVAYLTSPSALFATRLRCLPLTLPALPLPPPALCPSCLTPTHLPIFLPRCPRPPPSQILGYRLPFRRLITRTQIVQFVASFALAAPMVATHLLRSGTKGGGGGCAGMPALGVSAFCNASYLALFLRFYRKA